MLKDRLKQTRKEKGWTQKELAFQSDVSLPTIKRYETGYIPKKITTELKAIAEKLGVYDTWLYSGRGYKNHSEELLAQLADEEKNKYVSVIRRIMQKSELHKIIEEIYYPDFKKEAFSNRKRLLAPIKKTDIIDTLTDEEWACIERYSNAEQRMFEDIDNYIAIRAKKFINEIMEG